MIYVNGLPPSLKVLINFADCALGIEALLKLFFVFLKKSDCRKPDPCGNAKIYFTTLFNLGSTGFDSEINETVSTSCNGIETRKRLDQLLNGENNYALAA